MVGARLVCAVSGCWWAQPFKPPVRWWFHALVSREWSPENSLQMGNLRAPPFWKRALFAKIKFPWNQSMKSPSYRRFERLCTKVDSRYLPWSLPISSNGFGQSSNETGLDPRPIRSADDDFFNNPTFQFGHTLGLTDYGFVTGTQSFTLIVGNSDWRRTYI